MLMIMIIMNYDYDDDVIMIRISVSSRKISYLFGTNGINCKYCVTSYGITYVYINSNQNMYKTRIISNLRTSNDKYYTRVSLVCITSRKNRGLRMTI